MAHYYMPALVIRRWPKLAAERKPDRFPENATNVTVRPRISAKSHHLWERHKFDLSRAPPTLVSKLDSLCKPQFTARDDTMHSTREGLLNQQRVRALNIEDYYWFASAPSLNRLFYRFQVSLLLNACAPSDSRFYGRVSNLRPNANTPKGHGRGV